MERKILISFAVFLLAVSAAFWTFAPWPAAAAACEKCEDVVNTFTLDEVELAAANNAIKLVGRQSHGLKALSISCQLACGKLNYPCCYNVQNDKYGCSYNYLYCSTQDDSGICLKDTTPPVVSVQATPANALPSDPSQGCASFTTTPAKVYVTCNDTQTGCLDETKGIMIYYASASVPATCPTQYSGYYPVSNFDVVEHSYICGAAKDRAENAAFSPMPIELCVDTEYPYPPWLWYTTIGGTYVDLTWYQAPLNGDFDHYELHYSTQPNFQITPQTLYATYTVQQAQTTKRIEGLEREKAYYFEVLVFDKTSPRPLNSSSGKLRIDTAQCNPNEKTKCFTDQFSSTTYGVNAVTRGACRPGNATCSNGFWGYCENQTGPFVEQCNGVDDDCDGFTDNQWTGYSQLLFMTCTAYGICGAGSMPCINGAWPNEKIDCSSRELARTEICNGLDDDCDGVIDDVGGGRSVNETQCSCYGGAPRTGEICNGIDDDCSDWSRPHEGIDDVYDPQTCACYRGARLPGNLSETCNGVDDDCDGKVDETWADKLGSGWPLFVSFCGGGTPCAGGHWECNAAGTGTVCSTIGGSENIAAQETCNWLDDDCDGAVDETCACSPGNWTYCGSGKGECVQGMQECNSSGLWGACVGSKPPATEICNGKDDDCDGVIDNVHGGSSVTVTQCKCYNGGTPEAEKCNGIDDNCDGIIDNVGGGNSMQTSRCGCFGGSFRPGQSGEICNGIDDDCNGTIDDKWPDVGKPCGTGVCSGGAITCAASGNATVCSTTSYNGIGNTTDKRKAEVCNGLDDDCDGVIDDVDGKQSVEETRCGCYGGRAKGAERCNRVDDDCDGAIDEDIFCICFEGQTRPCGSALGECELGQAACANGTWGICSGGKGSAKETCNMKDDDCDGVIDNVGGGYSVEATQCGCYNGKKPSIEICDGIDNDCNAAVDDDIDCRCNEGDEMACGSNVGECMPGVKNCVGGKWGECKGGVLPSPEACNGKDDDCNGVIDDVNGGNSIGSTQCACYNRFAMPGTQDEICNGIDDDCDGAVDEGCPGEEPSHCSNGVQDGDEEGVDCSGSCRKVCQKAIPVNTWIIVFAAIAAVIAIFGIFFSSLLKGEKRSLFERAGRKGMAKMSGRTGQKIILGGSMLAVFLAVVMLSLSMTMAAPGPSQAFVKNWTCANSGFQNCYQEGCMAEQQLRMDNNQYSLDFSAPKAGKYTCTVTAVANHFNAACPSGATALEQNEKTDVYINGVYAGTTTDPYCNLASECSADPPRVCVNNVPGGDDGLVPYNLCQYLSGGKVCKAGSITFKIPFSTALQSDLQGILDMQDEEKKQEQLRLLFVLGNTHNRNLVSGRIQYYEGRLIVKIGGGSCSGCWSCCMCKDAFCGSEVYRSGNSIGFDHNADNEFKIEWTADGDVCIRKGGDWQCFSQYGGRIPNPPGISFDSYCMAPKKCHEERENRIFPDIPNLVQVVGSPECTQGDAGYSCYVNGYGVGMRSSTCTGSGGGTVVVCGNGVCETGEACFSCPGDCGSCGGGGGSCGNGICDSGEDMVNCLQDCFGIIIGG